MVHERYHYCFLKKDDVDLEVSIRQYMRLDYLIQLLETNLYFCKAKKILH